MRRGGFPGLGELGLGLDMQHLDTSCIIELGFASTVAEGRQGPLLNIPPMGTPL